MLKKLVAVLSLGFALVLGNGLVNGADACYKYVDNSMTNIAWVNNCNKNHNHNENHNRNLNLNLNEIKVMTKVEQEQHQAQLQLQMQMALAVNKGVNQTTIFKSPVNYSHITPDIGKTDADTIEMGDADPVLINQTLWRLTEMTYEQANRACGNADYELIPALLEDFDGTRHVDYVSDASGFFGSLTVRAGDGVSADQLKACATKEAMKAGATAVKDKITKGKHATSSKAGIDLGGSASVAVTKSGSAVIAPGGTLGYSVADASNEYRASYILALFRLDGDVTAPAYKPMITR